MVVCERVKLRDRDDDFADSMYISFRSEIDNHFRSD